MIEKKQQDAAFTVKTPAYIFHIAELKDRVKKIRSFLGNRTEICYAMKANPFLISELNEVVDSFEVCSHGEYRICERQGICGEKIVYSGVYKRKQDVLEVIKAQKDSPVYTVESEAHYKILLDAAKKFGLSLAVCLRLTSGNQFGMDEKKIRSIFKKNDERFLKIEGIQYYSGTQKKSDKIYKEIDMLTAFARDLTERYGKKINRIEYGPGLSVRYFEGEKEYCEEEVLREISSRLEADFDGKIVLEMGRFIAAECGEYVTSVVDLKKNGENAYCIVDGGINHLNYYGQMMAMKFPFIRHYQNKPMQKDDALEKWNICGSLCTTADVLVKSYPLANLRKGDRLVFEKTGAYSVTEGIYLFLSRDMPYIYKVTEQGELKKVRQALQTDKINSERRN